MTDLTQFLPAAIPLALAGGIWVGVYFKQREVDHAHLELKIANDDRAAWQRQYFELSDNRPKHLDEARHEICRAILRTLHEEASERKVAEICLELISEKKQERTKASNDQLNKAMAAEYESALQCHARLLQSQNGMLLSDFQKTSMSAYESLFKTPCGSRGQNTVL